MTISFSKYQGTGNDFVLIDNRTTKHVLTQEQVAFLCDRRMGIGADGLMLLEEAEGYDFSMVYYNSDGSESTMCGNGGRCITAFAQSLGLVNSNRTHFVAIDGPHEADIHTDGTISLQMVDVNDIQLYGNHSILNTGSPHFVINVLSAKDENVVQKGREIRYSEEFMPKGINVNFVEKLSDNSLYVRTYERGVEDETLSCGTGVTAACIASTGTSTGDFSINVLTPGGQLNVRFSKITLHAAENVILSGPAQFVFKGEITL